MFHLNLASIKDVMKQALHIKTCYFSLMPHRSHRESALNPTATDPSTFVPSNARPLVQILDRIQHLKSLKGSPSNIPVACLNSLELVLKSARLWKKS